MAASTRCWSPIPGRARRSPGSCRRLRPFAPRAGRRRRMGCTRSTSRRSRRWRTTCSATSWRRSRRWACRIRIETRSGDTPSDRKKRQRARPPHVLLTTPESLSLLLSYPDSFELFRGLKRVVIDEVHAFATGKRGDLLALALTRLQAIAPDMQRAALSATVASPEALPRMAGAVGRNRFGRTGRRRGGRPGRSRDPAARGCASCRGAATRRPGRSRSSTKRSGATALR